MKNVKSNTEKNQELRIVKSGSQTSSDVENLKKSVGLPIDISKESILNPMNEKVLEVDINKVEIHPRVSTDFKPKQLYGLKLTMKIAGLLEPLKVVRSGEMFQVFDGRSRYLMGLELGWSTIQVQVFDFSDEKIEEQFVLRNYRTKRSIRYSEQSEPPKTD